MGAGTASGKTPPTLRRYRHKGMERSCVYKSNKDISRQDFADALAYKIRLKTLVNSAGSLQSIGNAYSTKYLMLATRLSRLSPVIKGATEASPQPCRPLSSVRHSNTVFASATISRDILMGSIRGMDKG